MAMNLLFFLYLCLLALDASILARNAIETSRVGLSRSGSRFSKMFPGISQKVPQKSLEKTKIFFGLMLKYANCTTKVRFLSIFVQFCGVTNIAK